MTRSCDDLEDTSFVGRDSEVTELESAVHAHRLVTLTGVGGVGKTRLALQAAAHLVPDFPEGVWVVELAPVGDPAAVPDAVAAVLGVTQQGGMTVAQSVANALDGRHRLLVFDNCRHLLDATAELIEAILARSATVKILATSREGLRVADEHVWPVPSLSVREGADSAGVTLFVERAGAAVGGFSLAREADAAAVVEVCRRLDGIPLAIELAAARMVSMTPSEVRDRLHDRFRLLAGSRRGLERHQTLRHAVQWSYDLLDDLERAVLNRCSVFAGGFNLAAAVAVGGAGLLDEYTVLDLLDALVRKSLISADRSSGHTRYAILETIRQFGEDQLGASGLGDDTRDMHARYFAGQEPMFLALWAGPHQRDANDWLEQELANLRAAFRWATDHGDLETAAAIAIVGNVVGESVALHEPITWAEELLGPARLCNHRRLLALYSFGSRCCFIGRPEDGIRYGAAALALIDDPLCDPPPFGYVGYWISPSHIYVGRPDVRVDLCRTDIERSGDPLVLARSAVVLGLALIGRTDEATAMADDVVSAAEATANPGAIAYALLAYGWAFQSADPLRAIAAARRGLVVARDSGNRQWGSHLAWKLAHLEAEHGDPRAALDLYTQSINAYHDAGDTLAVRSPLADLAVFFDGTGRHEAAATIAGYATTSPLTHIAVPELAATTDHLRCVLGSTTFDTLTQLGAAMPAPEAVRYALDAIRQARDALDVTRG